MSESKVRCAATGGHSEFDAQLALARLAGRLKQTNVAAMLAAPPSNIHRPKHVAFIGKIAATGRIADLGFERSRR